MVGEMCTVWLVNVGMLEVAHPCSHNLLGYTNSNFVLFSHLQIANGQLDKFFNHFLMTPLVCGLNGQQNRLELKHLLVLNDYFRINEPLLR